MIFDTSLSPEDGSRLVWRVEATGRNSGGCNSWRRWRHSGGLFFLVIINFWLWNSLTMTITMTITNTSTITITMMITMTQGLAHWMSVMAEHMNHESSLHPAYMWHNGIDQKMSLTEQQQLLQKGGRYFGGIRLFV